LRLRNKNTSVYFMVNYQQKIILASIGFLLILGILIFFWAVGSGRIYISEDEPESPLEEAVEDVFKRRANHD